MARKLKLTVGVAVIAIITVLLIACGGTTAAPATSEPSTPATPITPPATSEPSMPATPTPPATSEPNTTPATPTTPSTPVTPTSPEGGDNGEHGSSEGDNGTDSGSDGDGFGDDFGSSGDLLYQLIFGEVRFKVNEVFLLGLRNFEAVGTTTVLNGTISLNSEGMLEPVFSFFEVSLADLTTDDPKRDNYIKRASVLNTGAFPDARYDITAIEGLPWPITGSGTAKLTLRGNMTIRGTTKELSWEANATYDPTTVEVTASANTTFDYFGLDVPSLPFLASVENEIRLEFEALFRKAEL